LFAQFVLVRLHTDTVPAGVTQVPDAPGSVAFRWSKFQNAGLPYYEIVTPSGKRLTPPHFFAGSLIRNVDEFARFLQSGLDEARKN
jgi:hypothetical protein